MKISVNTLNTYLKQSLTTEQMVELFSRTEVEIEEILPAKVWDERIIIAKVLQVKQHPDADRLQIATVDTGSETIEVVCGAPNLAQHQMVVLAQVGATLPDGLKIQLAKLRGVTSNGMLCSAKELGISDNHAGLLTLPDESLIGSTLCDIWQKGDILDIKTPANRWDYLSLVGLARELAAQNKGNELVEPHAAQITYSDTETVKVKEKGECKHFVSVKMSVNNAVKSPQWLVDNLEENGLRSINPVVDITNFVMLETGQPSHAYDAKKLHGSLQVRFGSPAEKLTTLDGVERNLSTEDLVISDDHGAIALAGVMGGASTEVDSRTTEIILEVANFDRTRIRRAALRHGLRSEASARFERSLPLPLPTHAANRLIHLLKEVAQAEVIESPSSQLYGWPWIQQIGLRLRKAEKLLGVKLDEKQVISGLRQLGFDVEHFSITKEAQKHIGKPYLWGANFRQNGEDAFDCSYLIDRIYSKVGKMVGHTAQQQYDAGTPVEIGELKPGDVVFYSGHWEKLDPKERAGVGHNGLYIGGNQVLEAVQYKYDTKSKQYQAVDEPGVRTSPLSDFTNNPTYLGARRYIDNFNHIFAIVAPWWRTDVRLEEDIIEEIVKIIGYDAIPAELPPLPPTNTRPHQLLPRILEFKKALIASGLQEIVSYSFISERSIKSLHQNPSDFLEIANPLSREQQYLRRSMLPSHLDMIKNNQAYVKEFMCFEVARTYRPTTEGALPREIWQLGVTTVGPQSALRLKGVLDDVAQYCHTKLSYLPVDDLPFVPGRSVAISLKKDGIGRYGQLSKQMLAARDISLEVSFGELEIERLLMTDQRLYARDLPDYQLIKRDITFACQMNVFWADVRDVVSGIEHVVRVDFLDQYQDAALQEVQSKRLSLRVWLDLGANPAAELIKQRQEAIEQKLSSSAVLGKVTIN